MSSFKSGCIASKPIAHAGDIKGTPIVSADSDWMVMVSNNRHGTEAPDSISFVGNLAIPVRQDHRGPAMAHKMPHVVGRDVQCDLSCAF